MFLTIPSSITLQISSLLVSSYTQKSSLWGWGSGQQKLQGMSTFRGIASLQVQLSPFLPLFNPPTMLLTSASSSSCCVAASRSLRIHSFHETGQSQSSIQAAQAKREGKMSAPCCAATPKWGQRSRNSTGGRTGQAETQRIGWAQGQRSWNSA